MPSPQDGQAGGLRWHSRLANAALLDGSLVGRAGRLRQQRGTLSRGVFHAGLEHRHFVAQPGDLVLLRGDKALLVANLALLGGDLPGLGADLFLLLFDSFNEQGGEPAVVNAASVLAVGLVGDNLGNG